ncbi:hypothetical protein HUO14_11615 [Parasphingorhabdus flavimaris]|jgi:hypothetical protein|uniref:DUF3325 domain-containing protein n=1 Tax=Parasphingorhabdus flavimaris TaxID=266812 RepID=A0ABX2N4A6_9SPHN|nr:hypothetical protein [Parasphingorhabdus flavimaris]NVD28550.1 hypothetical protein [Parasphingorhabdus flavimaris]|tara:strand:+ start:2631 stop:3209 length:579 start_codon:yes stop_codon:yes gene_type:complete
MIGELLFLTGSACAIAAVLVLRFSWARPLRSRPLNTAGWFLIAVSIAAGWSFAGAWGVTVMLLWMTMAAFFILAFAAWKSPPARRKPSNRRAGMLPESGEPLRLGSRFITFFLVALAAMVSSVALAIATRWIALIADASDANANVLALFAAPLGWTILAFLILMSDSRKCQLAILAVPVAAAIPAFITGSPL